MSEFEVLVYKINKPVIDHPDADRLSLVFIEGYTCIAAKDSLGNHVYKEGDLVVYIPEGSVLPEWMMKDMDFWDFNRNKPAFRYVKAKKLRGIFSQGVLYPVHLNNVNGEEKFYISGEGSINPEKTNGCLDVKEGDDVKDFLGITKWEPVIPANMRGFQAGAYYAYTKKYDFDSLQKNENTFEEGEEIFVTEKLHGTLICIGYVPELNNPELFGTNNNIFVTSKGVGAQGHVYILMIQEMMIMYMFK